ncbi:PHA/PHB synthase family protein [Hydrogenophaga electricum]|uniref:Poly-beta-hydroxybutyrate polymerase n=1 Tax=Hydrogenophaga electricum TaxID=1230953 RepID=A0ABQ6C315_9BURK|nr:class I poly(R)-hydroxyalkanoic acid synthase [Hydrogenophaga electricum]GLS13120.1 poly-beta-hydroxybutyrate polymerase [Hydrogenophaga electricum]
MTEPKSDPEPTQWFDTWAQASAWPGAASSFQAWQQGMKQMTELWSSAWMPMGQAIPDRRFAGDAWQQDPRFAQLSQGYLQLAASMRRALDAAPMDGRSKAQWGFALRQVVDAMSPANCLATNPEAIQAAIDSGGATLVEGAKLFLADLAKGKVSMTDDQAFEVGRNVATTPGSVVFENELMQLIQYAPTTAKVHQRPLVIVPPCINKFYILDLQPDNSLVAHAVAQGHTVFLVSWRNITAEQGHLRWDDYLELGVFEALAVANRISGADQVNALGFCVGGTLLASALAVAAARGEKPVASVTLLTTLLDFSETGELGLMVEESSVAAREAAIGHGGVLHGRELAQVFAALRANDLIWPYVVNGYLQGKAPPAFDLLFWNGDDTNLPGPMYCWYLRNMYLENRLREPGGTVQCGVPVDLSRIEVPAFVYASREDHIVPWKTAYISTRLLGGDTRFVLGASGHVAGVINPPAKRKRSHWVGGLRPDAESWLDGAQNVEGSWWPEWSEWLNSHAGAQIKAPGTLGNADFPVIEPAPGRYVKAKAT